MVKRLKDRISSKHFIRFMLLLLTDVVIINLSYIFAISIISSVTQVEQQVTNFVNSFIYITIINVVLFYIFRFYSSLWEYASIEEAIRIVLGVFLASALSDVICILLGYRFYFAVYIYALTIETVLVAGTRVFYRLIRNIKNHKKYKCASKKRIMIIGAGAAGALIVSESSRNKNMRHYTPVVFIDDNKSKHGCLIRGVKVAGGRDKIISAARQYKVDEIILAIPSASIKDKNNIIEICTKTKKEIKTMPSLSEIIEDETNISKIRKLDVNDFLGREEVKLDLSEIGKILENKVILVTGGGGSIGSELCRQIAKFKPKCLIVFDIYENNAYELQNELMFKYGSDLDLKVLIGSVRDRERVEYLFKTFRPDVVFHAAAHKHVPLMEESPIEAIKNNVFGTLNVAEFADEYDVERFVLISTDKAVNPTNVMGATKRVAEMVIQCLNRNSNTRFASVRFGNVLDSNGSVVPLFKKQISHGGPVTVTHPEITRYFMTLPEAARLVLQAGSIAEGGEVFILDMGEAVKIDDLARKLITLSGFEPDVDIRIEYSGLRPGEKLYEELLLAEEGATATKHSKIYTVPPYSISCDFINKVKSMEKSLCSDNTMLIEFVEDLIGKSIKKAV